jgi:hypothetical protein
MGKHAYTLTMQVPNPVYIINLKMFIQDEPCSSDCLRCLGAQFPATRLTSSAHTNSNNINK